MCHVQVLRYYARKCNFAIRCTHTAFRNLCKSNRFPFTLEFASRFQRNRRGPMIRGNNVCTKFYAADPTVNHNESFLPNDPEMRQGLMREKILFLAHRHYNWHPTFLVVATRTSCVRWTIRQFSLDFHYALVGKITKCLRANDVYT